MYTVYELFPIKVFYGYYKTLIVEGPAAGTPIIPENLGCILGLELAHSLSSRNPTDLCFMTCPMDVS